jgi:hypothetical protein
MGDSLAPNGSQGFLLQIVLAWIDHGFGAPDRYPDAPLVKLGPAGAGLMHISLSAEEPCR